MSYLNFEKINKITGDQWRAKALGQYMMSSAEHSIEIVTQIVEATADEEIDALTAEITSFRDDRLASISSLTLDKMIQDGYSGIDDLSIGSDAFIESLNDAINAGDTRICGMIDELREKFGTEVVPVVVTADDLLNITDETSLIHVPELVELVDAKTTNVLSEMKIPDTGYVSLPEGLVNVREMVSKAITSGLCMNKQANIPITILDPDTLDPVSSVISFEGVTTALKDSASSAAAWAAGCWSICEDGVNNAIAKFDTVVDNVISKASSYAEGSKAYVKDIVANAKGSITAFLNTAAEVLGWRAVIDNRYLKTEETIVFDYTGASPMLALNLNSLIDVVTAVVRTVFAIGKAIWSVILRVVTTIGNWFSKAVDVFVDPEDFKVIDKDDESYTVDNYSCYKRESHHININNVSEHDLEDYYTNVDGLLDASFTDQWYSIDTKCCQVMIHFISSSRAGNWVNFDVEQYMKPKALNYSLFKEYSVILDGQTLAGSDRKYVRLNTENDDLFDLFADTSLADSIYAPDDADESQIYAGFCLSRALFAYTTYNCWQENRVNFKTATGATVSPGAPNVASERPYYTDQPNLHYLEHWQPYLVCQDPSQFGTITNLKAIKVCCAYDTVACDGVTILDDADKFGNMRLPYLYIELGEQDQFYAEGARLTLCSYLSYLYCLLFMQQYEKYTSPQDYAFFPYLHDNTLCQGGRYHIQTDTENISIAQTWFMRAVITSLVVASVIVVRKITKLFKAKKLARLSRITGQLDNKMWSGQKLTSREARKYLKANVKLNKINGALSGLASAASNVTSVNDMLSSTVNTVSTILGENDANAGGNKITKKTYELTKQTRILINGE